jgi:hypothetical protein
MSIDLTKWQKIGAGDPIPQFKDLKNGESLAVAEGVETFLVQFTDLKPDTPDYLYRSRLVLRPQYSFKTGFSDIEAKDVWLKPSPDPKEITIPFPRSFLIAGIIFRTFEFRRWNRYNRLGRNHDGAWKFELYKSLAEDPTRGLPPPPTLPSDPEWVWQPPQFP